MYRAVSRHEKPGLAVTWGICSLSSICALGMIQSATRSVEPEFSSKPANIQSINETGYRLCGYHAVKNTASEWNKTFSAAWDVNDSNLIYICSQNGLLKVINIQSNTENCYQLLFKRYIPSVAININSNNTITKNEKHIRSHWDKMALVPGKPSEMFFLMGVSNTLYYTALPGSSSPLAELTEQSSDNYAYGAPVLQIYSHTSRITSISVCFFGHAVATGDENGYIHYINMIEKQSVSNKSNKLSQWWSEPTANPSHQNPLMRAHAGPIFSLQWLPIFHKDSASDSFEQYLATGSEDRMVRVWKVTLGVNNRSVSVDVLMILDTMSTHVLCLKAIKQPKQGNFKMYTNYLD